MRLHPDAAFDVVFIANRLQKQVGAFTSAELHLFSYLACLLWLYQKRVVADWGYSFVGTDLGAPFSLDISETINELLLRGCLQRIGDRLQITMTGENALSEFRRLSVNSERSECLDAACASTAAFSIGIVGSALSNEPELRRAVSVPATRQLLEDSAQDQLHVQFEALRNALANRGNDLRLPAVVWLSALYKSDEATTIMR